MNDIEYLIISSSVDYSTDLVCIELHERKKNYIRLNRDKFGEYEIIFSLQDRKMTIKMEDDYYTIKTDNLKGVFFRAPVFLRSHKKYSINKQLYRSQWSSFIRNLIVFEQAKWINHPVKTYCAENKLYQLQCAQNVGLLTPKTFVGNLLPKDITPDKEYIVKSLDTALFYDDSKEYFTYSSVVSGRELLDSNIKDAPIIIQEFLDDYDDDYVCTRILFDEALHRTGEMKQWEGKEIANIMNNAIVGWKPHGTHRFGKEYGIQRSWKES